MGVTRIDAVPAMPTMTELPSSFSAPAAAAAAADAVAAPTEDAYNEVDVTNTMAAYMTAIGKGEARALGTQS